MEQKRQQPATIDSARFESAEDKLKRIFAEALKISEEAFRKADIDVYEGPAGIGPTHSTFASVVLEAKLQGMPDEKIQDLAAKALNVAKESLELSGAQVDLDGFSLSYAIMAKAIFEQLMKSKS